MEKSYVSPIIQRELERQYVDERILENPRSSEINDITLSLLKKMGNVFMYEGSILYEAKLRNMVEYLIQGTNYLEVDERGAVRIKLPEYCDSENEINRKEQIVYQNQSKGGLRKIRRRMEQQQGDKSILEETSYYNAEGIEVQRKRVETGTHGTEETEYRRSEENPCIVEVQDSSIGRKLFDIRNSNSFENLDLSKGEEVDREKQLTKIDKIRIAERTRNSIYGVGIKKILGFEMEKDQKRSDFQK